MPNQISGKDGTGASQVPFVGTDGSLKVTGIPGGGVQTVSGTVAVSTVSTLPNVNQGTGNAAGSPWAVSGTIDTELPAASLTSDNMANPTVPFVGAVNYFYDGTNWQRPLVHNGGSDGRPGNTGLIVESYLYAFQGTTGSPWDRIRVSNVVKTVSATSSGSTALWTPTSGKKFRIMRFNMGVTSNANLSAGAVVTISLFDANTPTAAIQSVWIPTTSVATGAPPLLTTGWIDLGNGILSATADNVLNVSLSATLAAGAVRIIVCGTEE